MMVRHGQYNTLLAAFVLGELDDEQAVQVDDHLVQCAECAEEVERLRRILTCTEKLSGLSVDEQAYRSAGQDVLLAVENEETTSPRPSRETDGMLIWRTIMNSRTTKLAMTAAAVIVVALVLFSPFRSGSVTFAQVIQPILKAQTVVYDMVIGEDEDGPVIHDIVKGSRIRRTSAEMGNIMILDLDEGKLLTFDPATKGAVYIDIGGMLQEGTKDYLGFVRELAVRLSENPDALVNELGRQKLAGREAIGFEVTEGRMTLTIWADSETRLPVRIELLQGQALTILKNIEFDVEVDDSQVSMDVPAGYVLADMELDMTNFSEEDFVETLRLWAETLLDGRFPERLKPEDLMAAPIDIDQLNLAPQEYMETGTRLARGYMFLHALAHGVGYEYAGKGVKLGDAEKAVFWYRPQDSETYRVIYGDLSVQNVKPEHLPK